MGRVICEKHDATSGPLCSKHTLDAVGGKTPPISFKPVTFDATGDGLCVIKHLVCDQCATDYGLPDRVSDAVWDDENRFPWVCPVCAGCLAEYEERRKCDAMDGNPQ
jgi:hypothetical protein